MQRRKAWFVAAVALALAAGCAPRVAPAPSAQSRQSVVLISLDGFRWDYIDRPQASHIHAIAEKGVRAQRMIPSFPSLTFPNHYTLVTGLFPGHHGIVANGILDPVLGTFAIGDSPSVRDARWWGGEPIWNTAEKQHERAAALSWPGNEAPINGMRPWMWEKFDGTITPSARAQKVLALLALRADSAPRLILQYFPNVDHEGHYFGPDSREVNAAIMQVDSAVGAIADGIARMGLSDRVNIIVVADHGMAAVNESRQIFLDDYASLDSMTVIEYGAMTSIAAKPGHETYVYDHLHGANPHLAIYHRADVPARFHYNTNPRISPIVALADEGWIVTSHPRARTFATPYLGTHGFDNQLVSMGALFVAAGPAFKAGIVVPPFQNIHVYDLLAHILGLQPAPNDGSLDSTRTMLRRP